jgi:hypothetical protein
MMLNDKARAELDQGIAMVKESLPQLWRGLYLGCVKAGFSPEESMKIVLAYIDTSCFRQDM